jgi:hypothetical protein
MRAEDTRSGELLRFFTLTVCFVLVLISSAVAAEKKPEPVSLDGNPPLADYLPFAPGEELTYQLQWWGLPAGKAVMRIDESTEHNGHLVWKITSTASSSEFVDVFYKVRDQVISLFDPALRAPRFYKIEQREGRYRANRTISFDQEAGEATYIKNDNPPKVSTVPVGSHDPLSCLYYLRALKLEPGTTVTIPTFPGKELHNVRVDILRRENIRLPVLGRVDTLLIQPHLRFTGIFRKTGNVYIWITDDDRKIPVRMKTAIIFGPVWADLVEGQGCRKAPKQPDEKALPPGEICLR